jgi:hypothetical protein
MAYSTRHRAGGFNHPTASNIPKSSPARNGFPRPAGRGAGLKLDDFGMIVEWGEHPIAPAMDFDLQLLPDEKQRVDQILPIPG